MKNITISKVKKGKWETGKKHIAEKLWISPVREDILETEKRSNRKKWVKTFQIKKKQPWKGLKYEKMFHFIPTKRNANYNYHNTPQC